MRRLRSSLARLGELFHRKQRDQELAQEIESHLQMHIEDNLRAGMTPVEARRQALIKFGGMESAVEIYRQHRGFSFGGTLLQDLRYALRMLKKSPGFTAVVVLSLALGIGANTAIFSLINAVMLKLLPVKNPERLILLSWTWQGRGVPLFIHNLQGEGAPSFSYPTFEAFRASSNLLSNTFAFANTGKVNLNIDAQPGLVEGELATGDYFSGLGVQPAIGRLFTDSDDRQGAPPTAIISYGYWDRRFGRDPSVIGKMATINRVPFTIIGVSSPQFFGVQPGRSIDVWLPLCTQPLVEPRWTGDGGSIFLRRDNWWLTIMGRLQTGVSEQRALAQLGVVFRQSASDPADSGTTPQGQSALKTDSSQSEALTLQFIPGGKGLQKLRDEFSKPLFILMTVVGLVLFIACANVANLLLARATERHKEIAVRLAVGAARRRLIRQLLTESLLLATIGGMIGLVLAYEATRLLVSLMSSGEGPIILSVRPDLRVLVFTVAISLVTGVLFGLAPALRGTRLDLTSALKENSKGSATKRHDRPELGKVLVVSQIAVSLLLLAAAALFVRTLVNLESINAGFDRRNILLFGIDPTQKGYKGDKVAEFYQKLQRRIEALPGVKSATVATHSLVGDGDRRNGIFIQGYTPPPGELRHGVLFAYVDQIGPRFFETMTIPIVLGRAIEEGDKGDTPKVAVINETLARKFFGNANPVGRRFGFGNERTSPDIEIVGVAADTKYGNLRDEVLPMVYLSAFQDLDLGFIRFEVRTAGDPHDLVSAVRYAVRSLDKDLPISDVKTQVEQIDLTLSQERLFAKLSSFFGLLALALAGIGIYGIMSYAVARRTNEIGIRMALGARQEDILRKVLREAFVLVFAGMAIGIPIALGALRLISSMLFGLKPTDPVTLGGAIAFMLAVTAIAGYLPARRASRVDPMVALRYE